jgi:type IV fimbrial biogenesis protein FimT
MKLQAGLTLVELMVTLAVAITLTAIAIPSIDYLLSSNRVTGQANALVTAMTLARSEALTRGVPVAVCAKASSSSSSTACGTASNWTNGWEVFVDDGSTTGSYSSADEQLVKVFDSLSGSAQVSASTAFVRYLRDGTLDSDVHSGTESFRFAQDDSSAPNSCVTINVVGQLATDKIDSTDSCP